MKVAILGAPQTGKTQLTQALLGRLSAEGLALEIMDSASVESISPHDLVLLCGLDLGEAAPEHHHIDQAIRSALQRAKFNFQVVYGNGSQRLENALYCIGRYGATKQLERSEATVRWRGPCDNCGDGGCEHRLFTRLGKG